MPNFGIFITIFNHLFENCRSLYDAARARYGKLSAVELEEKVAQAFGNYVAERERGIVIGQQVRVAPQTYQQLVEQLKGMGFKVHGREEMARLLEKNQELSGKTPLQTTTGEVYGFTYRGEIYLDESKMNPETPIHEYAHLWDNAVMVANPLLWKRGIELMRGIALWDMIANDVEYGKKWIEQGITGKELENKIASEVHARLVGKEGAKIIAEIEAQKGGKNIVAKLKQWLLDVFKSLAKTFGVWTDEMLRDLTLA